jgi:hypothetical protein
LRLSGRSRSLPDRDPAAKASRRAML